MAEDWGQLKWWDKASTGWSVLVANTVGVTSVPLKSLLPLAEEGWLVISLVMAIRKRPIFDRGVEVIWVLSGENSDVARGPMCWYLVSYTSTWRDLSWRLKSLRWNVYPRRVKQRLVFGSKYFLEDSTILAVRAYLESRIVTSRSLFRQSSWGYCPIYQHTVRRIWCPPWQSRQSLVARPAFVSLSDGYTSLTLPSKMKQVVVVWPSFHPSLSHILWTFCLTSTVKGQRHRDLCSHSEPRNGKCQFWIVVSRQQKAPGRNEVRQETSFHTPNLAKEVGCASLWLAQMQVSDGKGRDLLWTKWNCRRPIVVASRLLS